MVHFCSTTLVTFYSGIDTRYCSDADIEPEALSFLLVEVSPNFATVDQELECTEGRGLIKISLTNGHHMEMSGSFDVDAVVRLARGLSE